MARSPNAELEGMSDAQIRELIENARGVMSDRFSSRIDEWRALAHEAGYTLTATKLGEEERNTTRRRRKRGSEEGMEGDDRRRSVAPKFRNPDNHSETWTGRGREPKWFGEQMAKGKSREDLQISPRMAEAEA